MIRNFYDSQKCYLIATVMNYSSSYPSQLSGGLQIFFGATFAWNHLNYSLVLGNHFWIPSTVLLCLGPVTYLLCWLGWNAVSKRNRSYLKIVRKFHSKLVNFHWQIFLLVHGTSGDISLYSVRALRMVAGVAWETSRRCQIPDGYILRWLQRWNQRSHSHLA